MKEFSNILQLEALKADKLPTNKTTDIPIFNVPVLHHPKKNTPLLSTKKDKKGDKQNNVTQTLFDYVAEQAEVPITLTSGISETTKTSEQSEPVIDKISEHIEPNNKKVSSAFSVRQ